jgi:hypothetical protein
MRFAILLLLVGMAFGGMPAHSAETIDRIGVPGQLEFAGRGFELAWSARPAPTYFKQEYVPPAETVERFENMILVEAHRGDWRVEDALMPQLEMLQARRQSDPLVNFDVIQNPATGEAILDFIMSATGPDGVQVVEWNAYRYAISSDANGGRALLLFGISRRAYGDDVTAFLTELKFKRRADIDALATLRLPSIALAAD